MKPNPEPSAARFHASLTVSDLSRSVDFYRVLFGREPARIEADYAKFEVEDPALVLSLIPGLLSSGGVLNHLGIRLASAGELIGIQRRLEAAGVSTRREEGVECCHSRQTKFWVPDPDGAVWELYVLCPDGEGEGGGPSHGRPTRPALATAGPATSGRRIWQHHLADGPVREVPSGDNTLHEVSLVGSANLRSGGFELGRLLADVRRALRPGGEVRLHGLSADSTLEDPSPSLPGPAAAVGFVPAHAQILSALADAGFVGLRFERLSEQAHFRVEGVGLREFIAVAGKPGHRPPPARHSAIYLGPLAEVVDDFGNRFPRGGRVFLNVHDWLGLRDGPPANQFLCLNPETTDESPGSDPGIPPDRSAPLPDTTP